MMYDVVAVVVVVKKEDIDEKDGVHAVLDVDGVLQ